MSVNSKLVRAVSCVAVAAMPTACASSPAAPTKKTPPGVPLAALFDDGFLYGISADGRVFSGDDLRTPEPSLNGARSVTGLLEGFAVLGSAPDSYECAALANGDVDCRGSNVNGDLDPIATHACENPNNACPPNDDYCIRAFGPASYPCVSDWTPVPGIRDLAQVHRTCGIDHSGRLVCWGQVPASTQPPRAIERLAGEFAILDDGTLFDRNEGALVEGLANVVDAAGSTQLTACAVEADGSLWCWGTNTAGLVGDGTTNERPTPMKVGDDFLSVRIGPALVPLTACGVMRDGGVSCWGISSFDVDDAGVACRRGTCVSAPTRAAGIGGVVQVVPVDAGTALTLMSDGRVLRLSNLYSELTQTVVHRIGP